MLRFLFNLILLLAIVGAGLFYFYRGDQQFLDRARVNATRHAYSLIYWLGLTLPGTPDYDRLDARLADKGVGRAGLPDVGAADDRDDGELGHRCGF